MQELPDNNPPVFDRYFVESLKRLSKQHHQYTVYIAFRVIIIAFVLLLQTSIIAPEDEHTWEAFTLFVRILLIQNSVEFLRLVYFNQTKLKNRTVVTKVARDSGHCLSIEQLKDLQEESNQDILHFQMENDWKLRVSCNCYDFQKMEQLEDVGQMSRDIRQTLGQNFIKSALQGLICCYKGFSFLIELFAFGMFIYGVVLTIQLDLSGFQGTFLQLFIIFEIMMKPKLFFIVIIVALIPLILLVAGIYVCCCKKERKVNMPKAQAMTTEALTKCSECSICFQTFSEGENVIPLNCSDMHVFHEVCISGWAKINPTCPICRSQV